MAEGTNWWSVDEKDPYWQTKEGHKEAMKLYGQKPAWVKESSLEYNPRTGKYVSIEIEEFVDLVVPELQRRGRFRMSYTGTTQRDHLRQDH